MNRAPLIFVGMRSGSQVVACGDPKRAPRARAIGWMGRCTAFEVQLYNGLDRISGLLLGFMVVFSPWAFGTTQNWSIWTMNLGGYLLGLALLIKLFIRRARGYSAPRWETAPNERCPWILSGMVPLLAVLTGIILMWCLISAVNPLATFHNQTLTFEYHVPVRWLPHSLDRGASWSAFWMYLGLACTFWSARDWVMGKTLSETFASRRKDTIVRVDPSRRSGTADPLLPARLRRLLWLLTINGAILAGEAIIQRLANSGELLFVLRPRIHQTAEGQFGPYAYRSNAAQYFNLLWPLGLGFWWTINRKTVADKGRHTLLLACTALIAAAPVISTSRAGAIVMLLQVLAAGVLLVVVGRRSRKSAALTSLHRTVLAALAAAVGLGLLFGWKAMGPRMAELNDGLQGREELYAAARPMVADYPLFGTGPGTFETVSQLYPRPDMFWPTQLHNDWLQTRITFGWLGVGLLLTALLCVILGWFVPGRIQAGRRLVLFTWVGLAGCLLHARYDFPFQIHSTLFLFLLLCSVLTAISRRET